MARKEACRKSMKAFPREVADVVLHLVKDHEVQALMLDGGHVLLRTGGRTKGDTLKVSRCRKAPESVGYMRRLVGCDH